MSRMDWERAKKRRPTQRAFPKRRKPRSEPCRTFRRPKGPSDTTTLWDQIELEVDTADSAGNDK
jgi:hypothetical protein